LSSPATANVVTGDAQYTTRSYQKLVADATTNAVPCSMGGGGSSSSSILRNVNFQSGSATLTQASYAEINRVASSLKSSGASARLIGHTDSQGAEAANLDLSRRRAKAVYDALVILLLEELRTGELN